MGDPFHPSQWRADTSTTPASPDAYEPTLKWIVSTWEDLTAVPKKETYPNLDRGLSVVGILGGLSDHPIGIGIGAGAGLTKEIYPLFLPEPTPGQPYKGTPEQTVNHLTWALDNAYRKTPEGNALAPSIRRIANLEPTLDPRETSVGQAALAKAAALNAQEDSEQALYHVESVQEKVGVLQDTVLALKKTVDELSERNLWLERQQRKVNERKQEYLRNYNNIEAAEGVFGSAAALLEMSGKPKAAKVAAGLANTANKTAKLFKDISEDAAPALIVSGYFGLAVSAIALFSQTHDPESPFPAILDALAQIQRTLDEFRHETRIALERMDTRFGNLLEHGILIGNATLYNTEQIRIQLNAIQQQIERDQQHLLQQQFDLAELMLDKQNDDCFRYLGNGLLDEPHPDFIACRDNYYRQAAEYSRTILSSTTSAPDTSLAAFEHVFPFADQYNELATSLSYPQTKLANPKVWYDATSKLIELLRHFPTHLNDLTMTKNEVGQYEARQLDPIINAGEQTSDFIRRAAFHSFGQGLVLNRPHFDQLLDALFDGYKTVLYQTAEQLQNTGLAVDLTKGNAQDIRNYNYSFLNGESVVPCKDAVPPSVRSVYSYRYTAGGGQSGSDILVYQNQTPRSDLGREMSQDFGKVAVGAIQPDSSILNAIPNSILLSERLMPDKYQIRVCLDAYDLENLHMEAATEADVHVRFKVYVGAPKSTGGIHVITLEANGVHVSFPSFNLYFVNKQGTESRVSDLAAKSWDKARAKFGLSLRPVEDAGTVKNSQPNAKDNTNEQANKDAASPSSIPDVVKNFNFISDMNDRVLFRKQLLAMGILAFPEQTARTESARRQLMLLTGVGLNLDLAPVDLFVRRVNPGSPLTPTVGELVDQVVMKGHTIENELEQMTKARNLLNDNLDEIAAHDYLTPQTTILDERLGQLKTIRYWRERQIRALPDGTAPQNR